MTWGKTTKCFISSTMDFNAAPPWKELEEGRDQEMPPPGVSASQPKCAVQGRSACSKTLTGSSKSSFLSFLIFKVCYFLSFDPKTSSHGIFNSPCPPRLTPIPSPLHMWLPSCSICLPLPARETKGHASCRHGWSSLMCFSGTCPPWAVSCPAGHLITLPS